MDWTQTGGEWQSTPDERGCYALIYRMPDGRRHWQASQGSASIAEGYAETLEAAKELAAQAIDGWQG